MPGVSVSAICGSADVIDDTHIPVDTVEHRDLLLAPVLLEIGVQVGLPLLGSNAPAHESRDVVIRVRKEDFQPADGPLCAPWL